MKYGEHLKANISPEYGKLAYLNYNELDDCIRELAADAPSRYVTYCDAVKIGCEWFWNFRCHSIETPETVDSFTSTLPALEYSILPSVRSRPPTLQNQIQLSMLLYRSSRLLLNLDLFSSNWWFCTLLYVSLAL
jgi:hypothetical protein